MLFFLFFQFIFFNYSISVHTSKNRPLIFFDGYEYRQKGLSADGQTQFWQCTNKHCPGRAHGPLGTMEITRVVSQHNHPKISSQHTVSSSFLLLTQKNAFFEIFGDAFLVIYPIIKQVRLRKEEIKEAAINNPIASVRELNVQARQDLSDEQLMLMPSSSAVQRQVNIIMHRYFAKARI